MREPGRSIGLLLILGLALVPCFAGSRAGGGHASLPARDPGPPGPDDQDDEEREVEAALTRRSLEENCLMCHAEEMITRQRLTPKQWAAEVEKMIGWGAPVPEEERGRLIRYLSERYPPDAPAPEPPRTSSRESLALEGPGRTTPGRGDADSGRGAASFARNCANCHGADAKGGDVGTNLVEKPILLDPGRYDAIVLDGLRKMPAFRGALRGGQSDDILAWLRGRRSGL